MDRYLGDLLNTALEAGDELLRDVSDGVVHIPIHVPKGIGTLDFGISPGEREGLYRVGYEQAASVLASYGPLQVAKYAGNRLKSQLAARYGEVRLYQPVLAALARDTEVISRAKEVRAHIMLPTGRGTLIVVYQAGMEGHADSDLELHEAAGCCGRAWTTAKPSVADLEQMATNPGLWGVNPEEYSKIPRDRRSMLSVPILGPSRGLGGGQSSSRRPVGVLSVDSSTKLLDTRWVTGKVTRMDKAVVETTTGWANIVGRLFL